MFKISSNNISIIRGDSALIALSIKNSEGNIYTRQSGDKILFTVKQDTETKDAAIQKNVSNENVIEILPQDTSGLEYGNYVYDVQLTTADGAVDTIIGPKTFKILPEVTF